MRSLPAPSTTPAHVLCKAHHTRLVSLLTLGAVLAVLAACSLPPNEGRVAMHDHPQPFAQAHAMCWEKSMGSNYAGGNGQFGNEMNLYDSCMVQAGWTHSQDTFSVAGRP